MLVDSQPMMQITAVNIDAVLVRLRLPARETTQLVRSPYWPQ